MEFESLSSLNQAKETSNYVQPGYKPTSATTSEEIKGRQEDLHNADKSSKKAEGEKKLTLSEKDIEDVISKANKKIEPLFLEFNYKIHSKTNKLMISVINTSTKEVLREIPPEKALDALAKMWELTGILIDKKS